MTEDQGQPQSNSSTPRGRHHRQTGGSPGRNRTLIILALVVGIVVAAGVVTWFVRSGSTPSADASPAAATSSARPSATGSQLVGNSSSAGSLQTSGDSAAP